MALCRRPPRWLLVWWLITLGAALLASAGLLKLGWSERSAERVKERMAENRAPNAHHAGRVFTWKAGWINVGGLLLLAFAGPVLARPLARAAGGTGQGSAGGSCRGENLEMDQRQEGKTGGGWTVPTHQARLAFVLMILAITLVSAILNSSRLSLSLWGDEEFTARRFITGLPVEQEDGSWQVQKPRWTHTFWDLGMMNNHFLFSVLGRLSHEALGPDPAKATGPRDPWFSEAVIRLPAFIAGLLALPAMAWCLRLWGIGRVAAAAAVLLLALHPWYVRHAVDARGYALLLLWTPLLLAAVRLALNQASWPRWLLVGLLTFLMFYSYLGTVYLLSAIHGALLLFWIVETMRQRRIPVTAGRWASALALSAMLGLQLVSPTLPAIQLVGQIPQFRGEFGLLWWQDAASFVAGGTAWKLYVPGHPQPAAMELLWHRQPLATGAAWLVLGALALTGLWALVGRMFRGRGWLLVAWIAGAPALMWLHMWLGDMKPYHWYLVLFLPGLVFTTAAGLDLVWRLRMPDVLKRSATVLMLLSMFWLGNDRNRQLRHFPYEAGRDSVAVARMVTNPLHPDYNKHEMTVAFVMYTQLYDPGAVHILTSDEREQVVELERLMDESDRTGATLSAHYGSPGLARLVAPGMMRILENPEWFELVGVFPGHKDFTSREVRRYRPRRPRPGPEPTPPLVDAGGRR